MSRVLVAVLLSGLLLLAAPVSADNDHSHHKKADKQAEREAEAPQDNETEPEKEADGPIESQWDSWYEFIFDPWREEVRLGGCAPVGIQLTPPPPRAGVDEECLPIEGPGPVMDLIDRLLRNIG